jgi:hypothetical protein
MLRSKKAGGPRTKMQKHIIQDTRVTVEIQGVHSEKGKGESRKVIRRGLESLLVRQALIEIWSLRYEYWEGACKFLGKLLEVLAS